MGTKGQNDVSYSPRPSSLLSRFSFSTESLAKLATKSDSSSRPNTPSRRPVQDAADAREMRQLELQSSASTVDVTGARSMPIAVSDSKFRRLSLLKRHTEPTDSDAFSTSPNFASSLLQRLSFRTSQSRENLQALESNPSSPSTSSSSPQRKRKPPTAAERLDRAIRSIPGFAQELVDTFLALHIADATKKLRFAMAVNEFQRTEDPRERKFKGRKIVEIFLSKNSVFNILQDLPSDLDPPHTYSSSSKLAWGLEAVKLAMLELLAEIPEVKTLLMERLAETDAALSENSEHERSADEEEDIEEDEQEEVGEDAEAPEEIFEMS